MRSIKISWLAGCASQAMFLAFLGGAELPAAASGSIYAGWASVDITPDRPVALLGQMHTRISKYVHDPLTATALALETKQGQTRLGEVLLISVDVCLISREHMLEPLRKLLRQQVTDLDVQRVIISTTHTHTGPVIGGLVDYELPKKGIMQPAEYQQFLLGKLVEVAAKAWQNRQPALVGWGLGFAVVGHNRRALYADGSAQMYGNTNRADFRRLEGTEDHAVHSVFFWTPERKLTGIVALVPCPAQVVEMEEYLSADFWSEVRQEIWKRHGQDVFIHAMTGASGDQSPHLLFRKRAEEARRKRLFLSATQDMGRRISSAIEDALESARQQPLAEVLLLHQVQQLPLPRRMITMAEVESSRQEYAEALKDREDTQRQWRLKRAQNIINRFERQIRDPYYPAEVHVLRLGDVAIATNPFELFLDFGIRMEVRSPAEQTLVVQLSCGYGGYLPTAAAIQGRSYSTEPASNEVGPEGGDLLVDRTVEMIQAMWEPVGKKLLPVGTPATHD